MKGEIHVGNKTDLQFYTVEVDDITFVVMLISDQLDLFVLH